MNTSDEERKQMVKECVEAAIAEFARLRAERVNKHDPETTKGCKAPENPEDASESTNLSLSDAEWARWQ